MSNEKIEIGDTVYLKTGSAGMMVEDIYGLFAECVWQDNGQHKEQEYKLTSLTKTNPNNPLATGIGGMVAI